MSFPRATIPLIHDTLIAGLNNYTLTDGSLLTASHKPDDIDKVSDADLPYLLFDVGNLQFTPWMNFQDFMSWDVPASLKVGGEPGEVDRTMMSAVQDVLFRTKQLIGLPVLEDGTVFPFNEKTTAYMDQGLIQFLAERGAPFIRSVSVAPARNKYQTAVFTVHLEAVLEFDPRGELPKAMGAQLGLLPVGPGRVIQDPYTPDGKGYQLTAGPSDTLAWGPYGTRFPPLGDSTFIPQGGRPMPTTASPKFQDQVRQVIANPYNVAISAGTPTAQLVAIAQFVNWGTQYITQIGTWFSDTTSVATISSTGLVTRVAAGTANITCTYQGVSSAAVVVTST